MGEISDTDICTKHVQIEKRVCLNCFWHTQVAQYNTYSGNSPSTRQTYSFCTCRFLICCSICRAFFGLRPNNSKPDVRRSNRWIVLKFFKLYSFAKMNTTVLWRYLPHGWTYTRLVFISKVKIKGKKEKIAKKILFLFSISAYI